jgi:hypothetical protein
MGAKLDRRPLPCRKEKMRNAFRILDGKPKEERPLGSKSWSRRVTDPIKKYIKDMGCEGVVWTNLAQDTGGWWVLENTVMKGPMKGREFLD